MNRFLEGLNPELRQAVERERKMVAWSVQDLRPYGHRHGLAPSSRVLLVMIQQENGLGHSITALNPAGIEDGHPVFKELQNGKGAYLKLALSKHGQFAIGKNKPMARLLTEGVKALDTAPLRGIHAQAFVRVNAANESNIIEEVGSKLLAREIKPAHGSLLRCEKTAEVTAVTRVGADWIIVWNDGNHAGTWSIPGFLAPTVMPGTRVYEGSLLAWPAAKKGEFPPEGEELSLFEYEVSKIVEAATYSGDYLRADVLGLSGNKYDLYLKSTGWHVSSRDTVPATVVEPHYRKRLNHIATSSNRLEAAGIVA